MGVVTRKRFKEGLQPEGWITTTEYRKKHKVSKIIEYVSTNFVKYPKLPKSVFNVLCTSSYYNNLFNEFAGGDYESIGIFVEKSDFNKSKVALIYSWKKYVKSFKPNKGKAYTSINALRISVA